jgi:hypothetical protein
MGRLSFPEDGGSLKSDQGTINFNNKMALQGCRWASEIDFINDVRRLETMLECHGK